ncbi:disease resistance protein (TIR-NBS-LRR class), partial [Trifolium pratense]
FYGVDPSEVRHQTGEFGKAFQNLLKKIKKVESESLELNLGIASYHEYPEVKWTAALRQAAAIAGFVVLNS